MILLLEWSGGGSRRLGASRNDEGGGPSGYFGSTAIKQSNSCGNTQGSIHAGGCMRIDRRRREPLHQCLESSPGGAQQVSVWSPVECRRWQLKALPRDLQRFSNDVIAIRPLVPRGVNREATSCLRCGAGLSRDPYGLRGLGYLPPIKEFRATYKRQADKSISDDRSVLANVCVVQRLIRRYRPQSKLFSRC